MTQQQLRQQLQIRMLMWQNFHQSKLHLPSCQRGNQLTRLLILLFLRCRVLFKLSQLFLLTRLLLPQSTSLLAVKNCLFLLPKRPVVLVLVSSPLLQVMYLPPASILTLPRTNYRLPATPLQLQTPVRTLLLPQGKHKKLATALLLLYPMRKLRV